MNEITDNTYKDELAVIQPVILDFWAPWCQPCYAIAPVVEAIAAKYQDRIKICKVNADDNPLLTVKYDVRGLPTLILIKNSRAIDRLVGLVSQTHIESMIDHHSPTAALDEVTHAI